MTHKSIFYRVIGVIVIVGLGVFALVRNSQPPSTTSGNEEEQVRAVVQEFGRRLKNVSLLSPNAAQEMREQYAGIVSEDILAYWGTTIANAPGRRTSSPWPERIDIVEITRQEDGAYDVQGTVIEMAQVQNGVDTQVSQYSVALKLRKVTGSWIITGYQAITPTN